MSSEIAIKVENLSKCYHIYDRPRDRLLQMLARGRRQYFREFWALRDVSFEIRKGETVGIIGRNGSGKSTLLQMICNTLNPTSGRVETNGRIAALLELGSGFNPEFTGRENVYMNAALLGLSKDEIDVCFDDIIAFADIADFIEQPVKTYSSGMFVRLAFAVVVHTRPAILIVDEALSVGDIAFQNKCMKKIRDLKEQGTSILFVSHDLSAVQIICDRVIWLQQGQLMQQGDAVSVCQEYYVATLGVTEAVLQKSGGSIQQQQTGLAEFTKIQLLNASGEQCHIFEVGEDICFEFELAAAADLEEAVLTISVYRADGEWMIGQTSREAGVIWPRIRAEGVLAGSLVLTANCLAPGDYLAALGANSLDHATFYAQTDLTLSFSVRSNYQTWGKFVHPCQWIDRTGVAHLERH